MSPITAQQLDRILPVNLSSPVTEGFVPPPNLNFTPPVIYSLSLSLSDNKVRKKRRRESGGKERRKRQQGGKGGRKKESRVKEGGKERGKEERMEEKWR